VLTQSKRMVLTALAFAAAALPWSSRARGQDAPPGAKKDEPAAAEAGTPKGPEPIPQVRLLPDLPTVPVRRGAPSYNVQMVNAALLPRDKPGIWVLDFAFKPLRMRTVEVPGKGRKLIHYLYYRVVNHTGKPREFVPQLTVITNTGKRYEEAVLPNAVKIVKAREDPSIPLLGAVDISGMIPPSTKDGIDDAVYGVAMWDNIDPKADRIQIYVRGLSDGYKDVAAPDGGKAVAKYKTLRIDLIRRGDDRNLNEKEIEFADPPYEWMYW
jgi:hypothetical protein